MSGILEVYLWLVIGKNIRNNPGNCHIVGIDQIMMSPMELLKCYYQFSFLFWYPCSKTLQWALSHAPWSPDNLNRLWHNGLTVIRNAVCWCRRDITAQEWKADNGKIEVIPFVVEPSSKLSIVNVEITIQVWEGGCSLRCFLHFKKQR